MNVQLSVISDTFLTLSNKDFFQLQFLIQIELVNLSNNSPTRWRIKLRTCSTTKLSKSHSFAKARRGSSCYILPHASMPASFLKPIA